MAVPGFLGLDYLVTPIASSIRTTTPVTKTIIDHTENNDGDEGKIGRTQQHHTILGQSKNVEIIDLTDIFIFISWVR